MAHRNKFLSECYNALLIYSRYISKFELICTKFGGIHFTYKEKEMRRCQTKTQNWEYLYINKKSCNFYYMWRPHAIVQTTLLVY